MANLEITKLYAGANITKGMIVFRSERVGIMPKLARFIGKHLKIKRLSDWGYEVIPSIREDEFKRPIGIALSETTILISGTLTGDFSD